MTELLTPKQAAALVGVSRVAIHYARERGELFPDAGSPTGFLYSKETITRWMAFREKRKARARSLKVKGLATIHGVRGLFDRWEKETIRVRPLYQWHPEDLKALLDELKPIYLLCNQAAEIWKTKR
jgi:hypothetical protein